MLSICFSTSPIQETHSWTKYKTRIYTCLCRCCDFFSNEFQHKTYWLFSTFIADFFLAPFFFRIAAHSSAYLSYVWLASFCYIRSAVCCCCCDYCDCDFCLFHLIQCHRWFHADQLSLKQQNMLSSRKNVLVFNKYVLTKYGHRIVIFFLTRIDRTM